jgi:hypothetical protein
MSTLLDTKAAADIVKQLTADAIAEIYRLKALTDDTSSVQVSKM